MFGKKKTKDIMMYDTNVISGLPIPESLKISVYMNHEKLQFIVDENQKFDLSLEKVSSIKYYNETEIEKVVKQSAPGMILGAATFGIVGAMLGGRVKTKDKRIVHHFLLIKYDDKEILVRTTDYMNCGRIADEFKKIKPVESITVTL